MGAGVNDGIDDMVMESIGISRKALVKSKQQNFHAGKTETADQLSHVRGYYSQVLGNDGEVGELLEDGLEEISLQYEVR